MIKKSVWREPFPSDVSYKDKERKTPLLKREHVAIFRMPRLQEHCKESRVKPGYRVRYSRRSERAQDFHPADAKHYSNPVISLM